MSEVFISYARPQEAEARRIAEALRSLGFAVWRDDELPAHRDYSEVIEERLRLAKAVVVVWSVEAVKSQWVRAEADVAREAGTLVQLSLDGAPLPLPFNRIQCADLRGWQGDVAAPGWRKVAESVAELVRRPAPAPEPAQALTAAPASLTPEKFPVAVCAFADPTGAATGDDFAEGLSAEIATALARFSALLVIDAESAARYRLEGSVRRYGSRVRINVQLRDTAQGERVWTERFDDALEDPFALQDDVASRVAGRVEAAILAHETRRLAARPLETLTAHELWLRARETIRRAGLEQLEEIEALSERAVALDPGHGRTLALLATALGFRIAYAGAGEDVAALEARFADIVRRAMLAGSDDPEVLVFVGEAQLLADKADEPGSGGRLGYLREHSHAARRVRRRAGPLRALPRARSPDPVAHLRVAEHGRVHGRAWPVRGSRRSGQGRLGDRARQPLGRRLSDRGPGPFRPH